MSIIYDDLYRYTGTRQFTSLVRYILFTPGFRYTYFYRKVQSAKFFPTRFFWDVLRRQCMLRTGIQIPAQTKIDKGLRIVHFGHIVINPDTIIGKNFNIAQGVNIGNAEGRRQGTPIIGDNVYVAANAVIVGNVKIGNDVFIAPNAFVNIDIPDGCIALGNPAQIIQKEYASKKYIIYKI
ncbi:serine O-acetyltransferase [Epilithonimonas hungarica]|uniref:Serine acetyltransferase n=1 Tax=Epilithonimonas hungarica TaxID=454006 RepID=A0A1G7GHW4_9FLAO|nr:serine acetyltransferase [Epilithonimonas hungarica]SDE87716.1 serine O-acetyltransferase [Epilithonimonas hungarica]